MNTLELALKATLPVIAVRTRDMLHLERVITHFTGKDCIIWPPPDVKKIKPNSVYIYYPTPKFGLDSLGAYGLMASVQSSLIAVNPTNLDQSMFDGGEVPVPKKLMLEMLLQIVEDKKAAHQLLKALGGCTIKEAAEYAKLTMIRDASLTAHGVTQTRKSFFSGQQGLTQIDSDQTFYEPSAEIIHWLNNDAKFFEPTTDLRLRPRGLLFGGEPGTGKTSGAKYIAAQMGVPLYRLDLAGTKHKYVGSSEQNLSDNLSRIDREEPCILLIDEIEKIFGSDGSDGNTTSGMLSQLLWWLAEHKSLVITIMTTNNEKKLPKELYREGRIDRQFTFQGLEGDDAVNFVTHLLGSFESIPSSAFKSKSEQAKIIVKSLKTSDKTSQAALTSATYVWLKTLFLQKNAI